MQQSENTEPQDNFVESRNPAELIMCLLLSATYAGLAQFLFNPLQQVHAWRLMIHVEGFLITIALLSFFIGLRPYISPSQLQLSGKGIKYKGPYWFERRTINWEQIFKLYISPELIVILYRLRSKKKGLFPMIIHSRYLADRDELGSAMRKYSPVEPTFLSGPGWLTRLLLLSFFVVAVISVLELMLH